MTNQVLNLVRPQRGTQRGNFHGRFIDARQRATTTPPPRGVYSNGINGLCNACLSVGERLFPRTPPLKINGYRPSPAVLSWFGTIWEWFPSLIIYFWKNRILIKDPLFVHQFFRLSHTDFRFTRQEIFRHHLSGKSGRMIFRKSSWQKEPLIRHSKRYVQFILSL